MKRISKESCEAILVESFSYFPSASESEDSAPELSSLTASDYNSLANYIDETIGVSATGKSIRALLKGAGAKNSTINILCAFLLVKKEAIPLQDLNFAAHAADNRYYVRRYFAKIAVTEQEESATTKPTTSERASSRDYKSPQRKRREIIYPYIFIGLILLAVITTGVYFIQREESALPEFRVSVKDDSDRYPKEIQVSYDLKSIKFLKDSQISFMTTPIRLKELKGEFTLVAPFPNLYYLSLISGKTVFDEQRILLSSDGWQGFINTDNPLSNDDFMLDSGEMHLKYPSKVQRLPNSDYYTSFNIFRNFNISGDNFELEADVKNPPNEGSPWAHDISVDIVGFDNPIKFNFLSPDAVRFANMIVGDTDFKVGERQQVLENFGILLPEWRKLTLVCRNKRIKIMLGDQIIADEHYNGTVGQIVGIQFFFKGSGYVKNVKLNGKLIGI